MKLYWRVKKDGKWTWTPASTLESISNDKFVTVRRPTPSSIGSRREHGNGADPAPLE